MEPIKIEKAPEEQEARFSLWRITARYYIQSVYPDLDASVETVPCVFHVVALTSERAISAYYYDLSKNSPMSKVPIRVEVESVVWCSEVNSSEKVGPFDR